MREILFRGKRADLVCGKIVFGDWVYGYYYDNNCPSLLINGKYINAEYILVKDAYGNVPCLGNLGSPTFFQVIPETVGQFTGLTDKNGNKIFEGDIIRAITLDTGTEEIAVVCFGNFIDENNGDEYIGFYIEFDGIKTTATQLAMEECKNRIEIIGNIFDNPELLEAKDGNNKN